MKLKHKFYLILFAIGFLYGNPNIELAFIKNIEFGFSHPTDITGSDDGSVYVLDGMNNRIVHISPDKSLKAISPKKGSIHKAVGIDYDTGIWVANTSFHQVCKISPDGTIERIIQLPKNAEPVGLDFNTNHLILSDRRHHQILVIHRSTNHISYIGSKGKKMGQFQFPGPIQMLDNEKLIVSDILNGRVVGTTLGNPLQFRIAQFGVNLGSVYRPKGIAIDSNNRIWVVDGYTGTIQAFREDGDYLGVGTQKGETIHLTTPTGMYIDKQNQIWIVESFQNRVSVWEIIK